ncbi:hypothetical protein [Fusobacterium sp. PH5-44]|uniref:hypothetical protein n=1 Tax=unclassified Fusobacterium TaxID=2648384 RepID=UPI003D222AD3
MTIYFSEDADKLAAIDLMREEVRNHEKLLSLQPTTTEEIQEKISLLSKGAVIEKGIVASTPILNGSNASILSPALNTNKLYKEGKTETEVIIEMTNMAYDYINVLKDNPYYYNVFCRNCNGWFEEYSTHLNLKNTISSFPEYFDMNFSFSQGERIPTGYFIDSENRNHFYKYKEYQEKMKNKKLIEKQNQIGVGYYENTRNSLD